MKNKFKNDEWIENLTDDLGRLLDGIESFCWRALLVLVPIVVIVQIWKYYNG